MEGMECKNQFLDMGENCGGVKSLVHTSSYTSLKIIVFPTPPYNKVQAYTIGLRREVTKYLAFTTNVPSFFFFFFYCDSDIDKFLNYNNKTHKLIDIIKPGIIILITTTIIIITYSDAELQMGFTPIKRNTITKPYGV